MIAVLSHFDCSPLQLWADGLSVGQRGLNAHSSCTPGVFSLQSHAAHAVAAGGVRRIVWHSTASTGIGGAVMRRKPLLRYGMASIAVLLVLRGFASAQTS